MPVEYVHRRGCYAELVRAYLQDGDLARKCKTRIADELEICNEHLALRLKEEGVCYRDLLDDERKRRCLILIDSSVNLTYETLGKVCGWQINTYIMRIKFEQWMGVDLKVFLAKIERELYESMGISS